MSDKTFNWKPSLSVPEEVPINQDGTVTLPIQMKSIIDKVDAMTEEEKLSLLMQPIDLNDKYEWS